MRALSAEDMIAPLIFLNRLTALDIRAHFRVYQDPFKTRRLIRALDSPLPEHLAVGWPMLLLSTLETKLVPAFTVDNFFMVRNSLDCIIAILDEWAPFHVFIVVDEGLAMPSQVCLKDWESLEKVYYH